MNLIYLKLTTFLNQNHYANITTSYSVFLVVMILHHRVNHFKLFSFKTCHRHFYTVIIHRGERGNCGQEFRDSWHDFVNTREMPTC